MVEEIQNLYSYVIGTLIIYSTAIGSLISVSRNYHLSKRFILCSLLGLTLVFMSVGKTLYSLYIPMFIFSVLLYPIYRVLVRLDKALHSWRYGHSYEEYHRKSFLGLGTYYFHLTNNEETTCNLIYISLTAPIMHFITVPIIALGYLAVILMILHALIFFILSVKALNIGYIKRVLKYVSRNLV